MAVSRAVWVAIAALGALLLVGAYPDAGSQAAGAPAAGATRAIVLGIDGPIGPATSDYVVHGLGRAAEQGAAVVVLRMDTPGGLDTSMREIVRAILASPVPVVTFVAPPGARAASAGTYIAYASHVAAMAPGTNLGAALVPNWRSELLSVITNPNVAYILMIVGIYGILFEFYSPGLVGPGVVGAISLLLALYAFQALPVNYAGVALILFGIALTVAEAFVPSFGILGLGGITALVVGSIMLMEEDAPGFRIAWELIGLVALIGGGLFTILLTAAVRARRRAVVSGKEGMIGMTGPVLTWAGHEGSVRVHGEVWSARARRTLAPGRHIRVVEVDGLTVVVEPEGKQPEGKQPDGKQKEAR